MLQKLSNYPFDTKLEIDCCNKQESGISTWKNSFKTSLSTLFSRKIFAYVTELTYPQIKFIE